MGISRARVLGKVGEEMKELLLALFLFALIYGGLVGEHCQKHITFAGVIDEIRYWNRALTHAEIMELYKEDE